MLEARLPELLPELVVQMMSETYDWGLRDLHIPNTHKETMGEGIKIGIVDSGRSEHFELAHSISGSRNLTKSASVNDNVGHSTFVSGIIAAEKNHQGIIGVAPKSKIYFAKAIDDSGAGSPSALVRSVGWCISQKVDIISISAGMFHDFKPLRRIIKKAYDNSIIVVAATGNTGKRHFDVAFPARYKEVIGVAAYDKNHRIANFSSRGINVKFSMPGVDIYSTWLKNDYCKMSGTSFACPIMAGICALTLAKHRKNPNNQTPCTNTDQMIEHLKKYSVKLGESTSGGFGTVDLDALISDN